MSRSDIAAATFDVESTARRLRSFPPAREAPSRVLYLRFRLIMPCLRISSLGYSHGKLKNAANMLRILGRSFKSQQPSFQTRDRSFGNRNEASVTGSIASKSGSVASKSGSVEFGGVHACQGGGMADKEWHAGQPSHRSCPRVPVPETPKVEANG